MTLQAIDRLEELVNQLLTERIELQERNGEMRAECDRLIQDRTRVSNELDELLGKLKQLEGNAQ